ncbi:MAG: MerR family transcriptional regulator [Bacteroidales bacterium]|jgi:DNA-binding transcriptional MerR regulator|nr:MerR family transcriptional regulator [Bacteroidales bacterium]
MEASNELQTDGKLFYSISEVADKFGVNTSLIRYWESQFDVINPKKNKKGNRMFTPKDVEAVGLVHYYVKERGMTLKGALQKIRDNRHDTENNFQVIQSLKQIRATLLELKENC